MMTVVSMGARAQTLAAAPAEGSASSALKLVAAFGAAGLDEVVVGRAAAVDAVLDELSEMTEVGASVDAWPWLVVVGASADARRSEMGASMDAWPRAAGT